MGNKWVSHAWWMVFLGTVVVDVAMDNLRWAGVPAGARMAISVVAGLALGVFWYRVSPRPLAHRLFPFACLLAVGLAFASFDFQAEKLGPNLVGLGLVMGLVFAEVRADSRPWGHQKRTALTSRRTSAELR
ncbi:MAG: hypothetical protein ACJ72E_13130 [Marmoricola sp.]